VKETPNALANSTCENPSPTRILLISLAFNIRSVAQLEIMSIRYMSDAIQLKYGIFIGCYEHFLAMALDPVVFRLKVQPPRWPAPLHWWRNWAVCLPGAPRWREPNQASLISVCFWIAVILGGMA